MDTGNTNFLVGNLFANNTITSSLGDGSRYGEITQAVRGHN